MNASEMARLLGTISLIDARVSRRDDKEKELMAMAWLAIIGEHVSYEFAARCAQDHYRNSSEVFMPAHVVNKWKLERQRELDKSKVKELGSETKSKGMPDSVREKLKSIGLLDVKK
jgi:hypothetical protein